MVTIALAVLTAAAAAENPAVPWGVCAHLGWNEFADRDAELALMQKAGIRWVRADFSWGYFEPKRDVWQFERYDKVVASAEKYGIKLLPILDYNVDWAFPAHEHLEDWCKYVKTVVKRYRGRIECWEVWNEENGSFWKPKPNPEQYARLLRATYKAIKQVAPEAQVVFGGTSGVPLKFIRAVFDAGGFGAFDVMAVHPYRYPTAPELGGIAEDLGAVKRLMDARGSGKKLWITEFGWPTNINPAADPQFLGSLIRYAARLRFPGRQQFAAAVLFEKGLPGSDRDFAKELVQRLGQVEGWTVRLVGLEDLQRLDPQTTQVLVMPTGEHYPADYFGEIVRFVRDGGLLVHLGGVPFYYADRKKGRRWEKPVAGEGARKALHVGWKAWWTRKGVPKEARETRVVAPADSGIKLTGRIRSYRWLTDERLKARDKFVPLLAAYNGGKFVGYPVAVYLYDSDLKGGFLSVCLSLSRRGVSEQRQGMYLPRAFLVALASGVQRVFWYEFRDGGPDPTYNEHRFGIVHLDMTPKPAYRAYATMTRALGNGRFLKWVDVGPGNLCCLFDTGRGQTAAVWRARGEAAVRLRVRGANARVYDYLGREVAAKRRGDLVELTAGEGMVYVSGERIAAVE